MLIHKTANMLPCVSARLVPAVFLTLAQPALLEEQVWRLMALPVAITMWELLIQYPYLLSAF
jgi:hypothetical protein